MNDNDFLLELMISGISVDNENCFYTDLKNNNLRRFKRFDFYYLGFRYSTYMEEPGKTPFFLKEGNLLYNNCLLEDKVIRRIEDIDWGSEKSWYIKTWNQNDKTPYELRLNPINSCHNLKYQTGENNEFKGCAFCHRVYTHLRSSEDRRIISIKNIFDDIYVKEGEEVLSKIKKVLIMTGNAKNAESLLNLCWEVYSELKSKFYKGVFSVSTNQITNEVSIKELANMDSHIFDYTLEIFNRRQLLMGKEKGYNIDKVKDALGIARKYFKSIRVTYVVGLDDLKNIENGFSELKRLELIDDVIPLIFVPYTPEMKALRCAEAQTIDYYKTVQELFSRLSLIPKKNGLSKDLFLEHKLKNRTMDSLLE